MLYLQRDFNNKIYNINFSSDKIVYNLTFVQAINLQKTLAISIKVLQFAIKVLQFAIEILKSFAITFQNYCLIVCQEVFDAIVFAQIYTKYCYNFKH